MAFTVGFTQTLTNVAVAQNVAANSTPPTSSTTPPSSSTTPPTGDTGKFNINDYGKEANAFGKELGAKGKAGAPTFDGTSIKFSVGGKEMSIDKSELAPKPNGKNIRYAHTEEDFEKQKELFNNGDKMTEKGGEQKDLLFSDAESDNPTLEGEVYSVLVDMAKNQKTDYSEDLFLQKTEEILGDMENVLQDLVTCDAKSALDTQSKYVHVADLKECQQVVDKSMTCDLRHDYTVGIIEHSDGPFNIKPCGEDCTELWIGRIGDNYWGGSCAVYEQWTQVRVRNPDAIIRATFDYAKWDDYMQVYVGNPGKETLVWTGPFDWRQYPNYFPPETPGACELSTSWQSTPSGPVPNCNHPTRCRYGGKLAAGGSMECVCNPRPNCMDPDVCEYGGTPKANGTDECSCRPRPNCREQCKYGGSPLKDGSLRCSCWPNPELKPGEKPGQKPEEEDLTLPWQEPDPEPEPEPQEDAPDSAPSYEKVPGVDLTPFFKNAKDGELINFKIRVSVTGGGEGFGRIHIKYDPNKIVSNDLWKTKDCLDAALAIQDGMAKGSFKCTNMPEMTSEGCAWISGVLVCPHHLAEAPLPDISRFCRQVKVDSNFTFNKGDMGCWKVMIGFDDKGNGIYDVVCGGENVGGNLDTCTKYKEDPKCKFVSSTCTGGMTGHVTGTCYVNDVVYDCGEDVKVDDVSVETNYKCDGIACLGENCIDVDRTQSTDFAKVNALLNAMQYMAQDMACTGIDADGNPIGDQNVECTVFGGNVGRCKIAVGGWQDCCEPVGGPGLSEYIAMIKAGQRLHAAVNSYGTAVNAAGNASSIGAQIAGSYAEAFGKVTEVLSSANNQWFLKAFSSAADNIYSNITDFFSAPLDWFVKTMGKNLSEASMKAIAKVFGDAGFKNTSQVIGAAAEKGSGQIGGGAGGGAAGDTVAQQTMGDAILTDIFGPQVGAYVGSIISFVGWVYLAYQIANLIIQLVYKCEEEEYKTVSQRETKNCHYVGSYCKSKKLGICIVKQRSYCCYQSPLSRIINEQIKATQPEILTNGGDWGTPQNPKCDGIPLNDVAKINWDLINLDEWTALLVQTGNMVTADKINLDELTGKASLMNWTKDQGGVDAWGTPPIQGDTDIAKKPQKAAAFGLGTREARNPKDRLNTIERIEHHLEDVHVDRLRIEGAPCVELEVGNGMVYRGGCGEMSNSAYICRHHGALLDCEEIAYQNSLGELLGNKPTSHDYWEDGYRCYKGDLDLDCSTLYSKDAYIKALEEFARIIGGTTYLNRYVCLDKTGKFTQRICEHAMEQNYCGCQPGQFVCLDGNKPIACGALGEYRNECECMRGQCEGKCQYGGVPNGLQGDNSFACSTAACPYGFSVGGQTLCNKSTCAYGTK